MMSDRSYNGQFSVLVDLLVVTIPQAEIIEAMMAGDEQETLNSVCLAVAVVADAVCAAQTAAAIAD
jgi:hypothetical protein